MRFLIIFRVLFFLIGISTCIFSFGQAGPSLDSGALSSASKEKWKEDLDFLKSEILRIHPHPFNNKNDFSRKEFGKAFREIELNLSKWDESKIVTAITRIMGSLNDGHSAIDQFTGPPNYYGFRFFPFSFYYFPDGIFVTSAFSSNKHLIGQQLVSIDGVSTVDIIKKLTPLISKDYGNSYAIKDASRFYIVIAQYLHGLGIIKKPNEAIYQFKDSNGKITDVKVASVFLQSFFGAFDRSGNAGKPLYRQDPMKYYWYRHLPQEQTLYIKYTFEQIDTSLRPEEFCKKMQALIDTSTIKKVVLDLRQNQGGNIMTLKPLYAFLLQPGINQSGKLFVLTDRRTQSAATVIAIRLSMNSKAIFIGEPSVTAINFFHNDRKIVLPNSKIRLGISSDFLQAGFPKEKRNAFIPDIPMEMTAKDYFLFQDPVLEYVLHFPDSKPVLRRQHVVLEGFTGKYQYFGMRVLEVKNDSSGGYSMIIEDGNNIPFLNTAIIPASSRTFSTDIRGVSGYFKKNKLVLVTPQGKLELPALSSDYRSPGQLLTSGEIDKAILMIRQSFPSLNKDDRTVLESLINSCGYQQLNNKKIVEAISLFILNTELFPLSSNTWDSLGESYARSGNKPAAIQCYEKVLRLFPGNVNALKALEQLK